MIISPLSVPLIPAVEKLIGLGSPYVSLRTSSDYWLYAELFSSTCPVALEDDEVLGIAIGFRSQDRPSDVYIQDVSIHPDHRRRGIAKTLLGNVRQYAAGLGCKRLYLTSEPDNSAAHATWLSLGFVNVPGDRIEHGVSVLSNYKGPGKDRAVYELTMSN